MSLITHEAVYVFLYFPINISIKKMLISFLLLMKIFCCPMPVHRRREPHEALSHVQEIRLLPSPTDP